MIRKFCEADAVDFYQKFGYKFKNGAEVLDEEGYYRLEKFNDRESTGIESENSIDLG